MNIQKLLILGAAGSMGARHIRTLRAVAPQVELIRADPTYDLRPGYYNDWRVAINQHRNVNGAIICSPMLWHFQQMKILFSYGIPFYVEKPPCLIDEIDEFERLALKENGLHCCAVGFQYRFHPNLNTGRWQEQKRVRFYARDDLLSRYGATCLETMTSHPIDSALYAFGPTEDVSLVTDGLSVAGDIVHRDGRVSEFDLRIDEAPRVSLAITTGQTDDLSPDDGMYRESLLAWLDWLQTGRRRMQTATLVQSLAVMKVMAACKRIDETPSVVKKKERVK